MTDITLPAEASDVAPDVAALTITGMRSRPEFGLVAVDLYRDIHKGIRAELFSVTGESGSVDPGDRLGRAALAAHVRDVVGLLADHADHEDAHIQPVLERHLPELAGTIGTDHARLEERTGSLVEVAGLVEAARPADQRALVHHLYLELASFTGDYLRHQDVEERVVMPALESAVGVEAVLAIHQAIVGSIPPEQMAASLAVMLPAMNLEDRTDLLGGMQAGAPPEVFAGVWGLAGSVLDPADLRALGRRLGLD